MYTESPKNYQMILSDIFEVSKNEFRQYLPKIEHITDNPVPTYQWDIPYTIPQLSYATHGHFRYYGKFPSSVGAQILESFPPPSSSHYVLDNFCGSGTTLVEAKLRGIPAFGVDIGWISVLVANVKVQSINFDLLISIFKKCISCCKQKDSIEIISTPFLEKWFCSENIIDLTKLKNFLLTIPSSSEKDFLIVAFLSIIRRVSRAYDGEVRPHINKAKRSRNVFEAFTKKFNDMVKNHQKFMRASEPTNSTAQCFLSDNKCLPARFNDGLCYLVISHPPYLNSFDYSPVYSLEYFWGNNFQSEYSKAEQINGNAAEMRAYPANDIITEAYYSHLETCFSETYKIQPKGGLLAVVIGDCTKKGKLEPVLEKSTKLIEKIGYRLFQINYRTTHYGLGKYAYNFRADYHGNQAVKRDGILIFKK